MVGTVGKACRWTRFGVLQVTTWEEGECLPSIIGYMNFFRYGVGHFEHLTRGSALQTAKADDGEERPNETLRGHQECSFPSSGHLSEKPSSRHRLTTIQPLNSLLFHG